METLVQAIPTATTASAASRWKMWVPIALFAILWVDLCRQLSFTWEANEQYAYGWFVPFFAIGLFVRRWMNPPKQEPESRKQKTGSGGLIEGGLALLLALALLPIRVIHEINPDWPLCSWALAMTVVGLS